MTRLTLVLVCMAAACVTTPALAQTSSAPRNVLPQPYATTRDWDELAWESTRRATSMALSRGARCWNGM
jgi:hypothetical protein